MGIAIISYNGQVGDQYRFSVDIGNRTYFSYQIGKGKKYRDLIALIDEQSYQSNVMKKENQGNWIQSSFYLFIDQRLFSNNQHQIQLISYKNLTGQSPAFSGIIEVIPLSDEQFTPPIYSR